MYKYSIQDMERFAQRRNGKCISPKYLGLEVHLVWECEDGHQWRAVPNNIIYNNRWCPKCSKRKNFTEEKCRHILEQLSNISFPSNRTVLDGLELDMYNDDWKVAIEYNGVQHYKFVKGFHQDQVGFQQSLERDARKARTCLTKGIRLFVVSYLQSKDDTDLVSTIKDILVQCNIPANGRVNMKSFYKKLSNLRDLRQIAKDRRGTCLADQYIDCETKIKFACDNGHVFMMEPRHVKGGHWCNECGNSKIGDKNRRLSLMDAQFAAGQHGGKCLDTKYNGTQHKLRWQCVRGHEWESTFNSVRSGSWCSKCSDMELSKRFRGSITDIQKVVARRGGKCLSTTYINNRTKLEFECARGHRWFARPVNIQQGKWCPGCRASGKGK